MSYDINPVEATCQTFPVPSPGELENMLLDDLAGIMEQP